MNDYYDKLNLIWKLSPNLKLLFCQLWRLCLHKLKKGTCHDGSWFVSISCLCNAIWISRNILIVFGFPNLETYGDGQGSSRGFTVFLYGGGAINTEDAGTLSCSLQGDPLTQIWKCHTGNCFIWKILEFLIKRVHSFILIFNTYRKWLVLLLLLRMGLIMCRVTVMSWAMKAMMIFRVVT